MKFAKGDIRCKGCAKYGSEKCHCMCHDADLVNNVHEIIYFNGEGSTAWYRPGEEESMDYVEKHPLLRGRE